MEKDKLKSFIKEFKGSKQYLTIEDFTEEDRMEAKKFCDEISKKYGLDKIDKRMFASTDLDKAKEISKDLKCLKDL